MGEKWIRHASLLVKVPSISIKYCEGYKIPRKVRSLGLLVPGSQYSGPLLSPILQRCLSNQANHHKKPCPQINTYVIVQKGMEHKRRVHEVSIVAAAVCKRHVQC